MYKYFDEVAEQVSKQTMEVIDGILFFVDAEEKTDLMDYCEIIEEHKKYYDPFTVSLARDILYYLIDDEQGE